MPKPLRVAGEVDSYCTKCRMVLNHRIVSMKAGKAYQVECLTCRATHLWRAHAPGEKPAASASTSGSAPPPRAARAGSATAARTARAAAAVRQEQTWEKATSGRSPAEFKAYAVTGSFREGDLVRHKKFGDGVVTRVVDAHKVEVLFRDEPRTLAQALI